MSTIDLNKVTQILDDAQIGPDQRGPMLSIAVARAIGYQLQLPSSPVTSADSYYIQNEQALAEAVVSQINERVAIDVEKTCDLIRAVWTFRYRMVYLSNHPAVRGFLDGLVRVGSTEFPGYVSELMTAIPEGNMLDYVAATIRDSFQEA